MDQEKSHESNILVAVRVRPLSQNEQSKGEFDITNIQDNVIIILDPIDIEFEKENKQMLEVLHRSKEQKYAFDKIFKDETQEQIYDQTCSHLIQPVMSGYNATVFAYGPTGTGKTYTMLGNIEKNIPGIANLTIKDMFKFMQQDTQYEYTITITYVEIYNESIKDLLVPSSTYLELRDDPIKGIVIAGVNEIEVKSTEQIMNLLYSGNKRRTTESTNANQHSSRSHAVFQICINKRPHTKDTLLTNITSKLSLIDLAGSERGTVTENRGIRLREGAKINRSLLALANCINALGDNAKKGCFVPYRDSKLTRMLKDSLGGNCKTVMITNTSPASSQFEETINTLKYANRAKNIKTKVTENKKLVSVHIAEYKGIINDLRMEIETLKNQLHSNINKPDHIPIQQNMFDKKQNQKIDDEICTCNRKEDVENMNIIQSEIMENFQERIQLRRALMELDEQNSMNILEIKKKQAEIVVWNKSPEKTPKEGGSEILQNKQAIHTLKASTDKNAIKREIMNLQLMENIIVAKRIREEIPKKIKHQDKRDFLEMVIKSHILELQNIELEIHLQIQEKSISDLKSIIDAQKKIINENNLKQKIDLDDQNSLNDNDIDLEEIMYVDDIEKDQQELDEDLEELKDFKDFLEKTQQNFWPQNNCDNRQESLKEQKSIDIFAIEMKDEDKNKAKPQTSKIDNKDDKKKKIVKAPEQKEVNISINGNQIAPKNKK